MQIFFLATNPVDAARQQCDQHVIKMLLESAQLLFAAHHRLDADFADWPGDMTPYKATHTKHPDALWAASCIQNYRWLHRHACALADEYTTRFNKTHATTRHLPLLATPPESLSLDKRSNPFQLNLATIHPPDGCVGAPLCFDEDATAACRFETPDGVDVVTSYQHYYLRKAETFKRPMRFTDATGAKRQRVV